VQDDGDLEETVNIIASSIGSMQNPLKLQNTFRSVKQSNITSETIKRYLDYMQDAYLIEKAVRYDIRGKRYISTPQKYYFEDLGLRNARLNFRQAEPTHLMENLVYNELRSRGFSVDVGQVVLNSKNEAGVSQRRPLEVDFVCNMGYKRCYIQSAYSMPSYDKVEQEMRSLLSVNDAFLKVIITAGLSPTHQTDSGVLILNLYDFLTDNGSLPL
jgi:predicted AAA+ superfamily ATPase